MFKLMSFLKTERNSSLLKYLHAPPTRRLENKVESSLDWKLLNFFRNLFWTLSGIQENEFK